MKIPSPYSKKSRTDKNFYRVGAGSFHQMRLYLESMDDLLEVQRRRIKRDRSMQLKKYPQDLQLIEEFYASDLARVDSYFKVILLESAFIASFALFESVFERVCYRTAYKYFENPEFNSEPGIINKYRNYLYSVLRKDFSAADNSWQTILRYSELRNVLAHHGSVIQKKDVALLLPFLKIRNSVKYQVSIEDKKFVFRFLKVASEFVRHIVGELPPGRRRKLPHW